VIPTIHNPTSASNTPAGGIFNAGYAGVDNVIHQSGGRAIFGLGIVAALDELRDLRGCLPGFHPPEPPPHGGLPGGQLPQDGAQGKNVCCSAAGVTYELFWGAPWEGGAVHLCKAHAEAEEGRTQLAMCSCQER